MEKENTEFKEKDSKKKKNENFNKDKIKSFLDNVNINMDEKEFTVMQKYLLNDKHYEEMDIDDYYLKRILISLR